MTSVLKPYALAEGEGRSYEWHDVVFTMKAAAAQTGEEIAIWDVTTRPGEEPHVHVHDDVHEMFYVLSGSITFRCGRRSFKLEKHGFAFVPRATPHTYKIHSRQVPQPPGAPAGHQHAVSLRRQHRAHGHGRETAAREGDMTNDDGHMGGSLAKPPRLLRAAL